MPLHQYALLYDDVENGGRAVWDEGKQTWSIPALKHQRGEQHLLEERPMTSQSLHRPETDYARRRRMVDPNPRWRTDNIVDLEMSMPARSTPACDDPNTLSKIRAILAMDINDPVEQLPTPKSRIKHRENQFLSLGDGKSKSRRKNDKSKSKKKSSRSRPQLLRFDVDCSN